MPVCDESRDKNGHSGVPSGGMHDAVDTAPSARWPWLRAIAFGVVSASIGTFGHAFVMGDKPAFGVLAVAALLMTMYARLLVTQRVGRVAMIAGVTFAQLLVHVTMLLAAPTTMHHMDHGAAAHAATLEGGVSLPLMLVAHALAIALGVGVLLQVERLAWRGLRSVAGAVVALVARIFGQPQRIAATRRPLAAAVAASTRLEFHRWITASIGRRGPPVRLVNA